MAKEKYLTTEKKTKNYKVFEWGNVDYKYIKEALQR